MGREIRRVPPNWQHPKKEKPNCRTNQMEKVYQPLFDTPYIKALSEWLKEHEAWERGEHKDQTTYGYTKEEYPHYAHYGGNAPAVEYYRPNWKPEDMTWWQVYETVSEGTPVTPPFATREELVDYLVANGDFWDQQRRIEGNSCIPCGSWQRNLAEMFVFRIGYAPSLVVTNGVVMRGVEFINA